MQKFIVDQSFWELFPDAAIAVLSLSGLQAVRLSPDQAAEISGLLAEANRTAKKYVPAEPISSSETVQVWRQAYRKFPVKKGARCSVEALLKRVLHGNPVQSIAPSVDITNAISLKYAFPIGAENLDAVKGDLHLGAVRGGEDFLPIGAEAPDPPLPGEIAYYDDIGAVCRCMNWRDGQRTQIRENTVSEFIAMECIERKRRDELVCALDELSGLMVKHLGAKIAAKAVVTQDNPSAVLRQMPQ